MRGSGYLQIWCKALSTAASSCFESTPQLSLAALSEGEVGCLHTTFALTATISFCLLLSHHVSFYRSLWRGGLFLLTWFIRHKFTYFQNKIKIFSISQRLIIFPDHQLAFGWPFVTLFSILLFFFLEVSLILAILSFFLFLWLEKSI